MAWRADIFEDGSRHVTPEDDAQPHTFSMECWCHPFRVDGIIVHNSMDGREDQEPDGRLPGTHRPSPN